MYQGDQGLQGGWAIDDAGSTVFPDALSMQFGAMQAAGAGWVRINFRLGACYADWDTPGCNGRSATEMYDEVVDTARTYNLRVLGLLSNETWHGDQGAWNANNAETGRGYGDNDYIIEFATNAQRLVTHFRDRVEMWEVWNEPNAWNGLARGDLPIGSSYIYPSNFAWLLRRTYVGIKQAQPEATVILGGLFAHDFGGGAGTVIENGVLKQITKVGILPGALAYAYTNGGVSSAAAATSCSTALPSGADYLCATYQMGITRAGWRRGTFPFDGVGQHLYIDQSGSTSRERVASYLQDLRNAYQLYELPNTPKMTYITELAWGKDSVDADLQAANLQAAFDAFRGASYVARAFWFGVQDMPTADHWFGLVDSDGVPLPSFSAYQASAIYWR